MGCFKICFGTCNNQKLPPKQLLPSLPKHKRLERLEPLQPTKSVQASKAVIFESNCGDAYDIPVDKDNNKKECEIDNAGNEKVGNIIGMNKAFHSSIIKLGETGELDCKGESSQSRKEQRDVAKIGDLLVQEESSVSVESRNLVNGLDKIVQEESSDSLFSVSVGSKKRLNAAEDGDLLVEQESSDSLFSVSVGSIKKLNAAENDDLLLDQEESFDSLFSVSIGSKKKLDVAANGDLLVQEDSSDSIFSVSIESRKQVDEVNTEENEVTSPVTFKLKPIIKYNNSSPTLSNSVLNLTNWKKTKKAKTDNNCTELKDREKENVNSVQGLNSIPFSSEKPSLKKLKTPISKQQKGGYSKVEVSPFDVDTSLSSWLVISDKEIPKTSESSDVTGISSCSSRKFEDTLTFGTLNCEALKQNSVTSSPRRSPSRYSSNELSIIGTVGSYWNHTGQMTNSSCPNSSCGRMSTKFKKDNIINCHSTPLTKRLEGA